MNSSYGRGALVKRRSESSRPFVEREWRTLEMDCEESEALGRPDGTGMLCLRSFRTALMGAFLFLEEWFPLGIAPEHAERQQRRTVAVRSYCLGGAKGRGGGWARVGHLRRRSRFTLSQSGTYVRRGLWRTLPRRAPPRCLVLQGALHGAVAHGRRWRRGHWAGHLLERARARLERAVAVRLLIGRRRTVLLGFGLHSNLV